jgi:glycosyl transferase, family 25
MNRVSQINLLNSYFNKIYVLTIPRAVERHNQLQQDLSGLNFDFFYGVDKQSLTKEDLIENNIYSEEQAIQNSRYSKPMKMGEIACSLGHKLIYEDIIKNKYSKVLVLEDDVLFNEDGLTNLATIIEQLQDTKWDLVYFDYNKNDTKKWFHSFKQILYHIQSKFGLLKWNHTMINHLFAQPFSNNLKIAGYHDYTSAYAINNQAAQKLLQIHSPINFPADHALAFAITNKQISAFITVPKVFIQKSQDVTNTFISYVED